MTTNATARRTYYVHHAVHVAQAGAENALCGVRLLGAIDTTADATCDRCQAHRFETTPGLWARVAVIGDGELGEIGGQLVAAIDLELDGDDASLLRTRRKLRRVDPDVRRYVAARFEGRRVEITDRNGGTYTGTVLAVSTTTSGAFSEALTLRYDKAGLWPVTLSLATVDEIRALP